MTLNFDLESVTVTEFGVGLDQGGDEIFRAITVDSDVQGALREMALATQKSMNDLDSDPPMYEPSEKHAGSEYVVLPIKNELTVKLRQLHEAKNLTLDSAALDKTAQMFCYFAR